MQEVYINIDDSDKLTRNEKYSLFGGIIFLSNKEKIDFSNKYRSIIKSIRCDYCKEDKPCSRKCIEVKSYTIDKKDRRRIINLCKQHRIFALIIDNDAVYDSIMYNKASKGRYTDYTQRVTIKSIIVQLIKDRCIDPERSLKLIINIDQQSTKSNGYYSLRDGIYEELVHGISNYNYGIHRKPILHNELDIVVNYIDSKKSVAIQAADIIAGTTRRIMYQSMTESDKLNKINNLTWIYRKFP